ncbi:hypothetical protein Gorai_022786, partial [Gossypium raimondii]|nr:hypothetical protein [Gossypium raimondii]
MAAMEESLADLSIDEEEEALLMMGSGDPGVGCLMRTILWWMQIESRRGGPWKFNFHLLLMHQLKDGKDPMVVPLVTVDFWVLVYDLPHGFMSEMVAMHLDIARVSTLFRFSRRSKILSSGGIFLYGFRQSERQCNPVFGYERMQGRRGWLKGWLAPVISGCGRQDLGFRRRASVVFQHNVVWAISVGSRKSAPIVSKEVSFYLSIGHAQSARQSPWEPYTGKSERRCLFYLYYGDPSFSWKQNCRVSLRSYSGSHIHILINKDSDGKCWRCMGFYGALKELRWVESWNLSRQLDNCPNNGYDHGFILYFVAFKFEVAWLLEPSCEDEVQRFGYGAMGFVSKRHRNHIQGLVAGDGRMVDSIEE